MKARLINNWIIERVWAQFAYKCWNFVQISHCANYDCNLNYWATEMYNILLKCYNNDEFMAVYCKICEYFKKFKYLKYPAVNLWICEFDNFFNDKLIFMLSIYLQIL